MRQYDVTHLNTLFQSVILISILAINFIHAIVKNSHLLRKSKEKPSSVVMASSTTTSTGKSYLFNIPGDFEAWSISFHNRTKRLLLQPYIDNGEDEDLVPWPEAPTYPDFANFP
jgi:hypothetical protein